MLGRPFPLNPFKSMMMSIFSWRIRSATSRSLCPNVDKALNGCVNAAAKIGMLIRPEGEGRCLESRSVMMFEHADCEIGDGVLAQVGRQIGDANPIVRIAITLPDRGKRRLIFGKSFGALELIRSRRRYRQKSKWSNRYLRIFDRFKEMPNILLQTGPVANRVRANSRAPSASFACGASATALS